MNINKLLKALDNEKNEGLMDFTSSKIKDMNREIIKELQLPKHIENDFIQKLENYKYVDEINDVHNGSFIRWVPINNPNKIELKKGALVCEIKITNNGTFIVCKGFFNKHFQIKMDECLIFQLLKSDEQVLLSALDHISK
jgi:hypothetical protein